MPKVGAHQDEPSEGFLTDVITDVVSRFWTLGIIPPAQNEEITVGWSDLLAPSQGREDCQHGQARRRGSEIDECIWSFGYRRERNPRCWRTATTA
ncbi:hypothetical protein ACVXG7_19770 [Enterobacter hormaechei]